MTFEHCDIKALLEIAEQAVLVRDRQREYFRSRGPGELSASKEAERELDRMLKAASAPPDRQGKLL